MPSKKILAQKQEIVQQLKEKMQAAVSGVFVDYSGINVAEDTKLRTELRNADVDYAVVKNTLTRFAAKEAGLEGLDEVLNGTTALAVSNTDLIAPAKILSNFADKHSTFKLKSGFLEGKVISLEELEELAKLPSKENLLCMLLYALNGNISGLARALQAIADQKEQAEPTPA